MRHPESQKIAATAGLAAEWRQRRNENLCYKTKRQPGRCGQKARKNAAYYAGAISAA